MKTFLLCLFFGTAYFVFLFSTNLAGWIKVIGMVGSIFATIVVISNALSKLAFDKPEEMHRPQRKRVKLACGCRGAKPILVIPMSSSDGKAFRQSEDPVTVCNNCKQPIA